MNETFLKGTYSWPDQHKWCGCPECGECECSYCNQPERLNPEDVNNPINCESAKQYFKSKLHDSPMPNINIFDSPNSENKESPRDAQK
jgi:hypothetical protein